MVYGIKIDKLNENFKIQMGFFEVKFSELSCKNNLNDLHFH